MNTVIGLSFFQMYIMYKKYLMYNIERHYNLIPAIIWQAVKIINIFRRF